MDHPRSKLSRRRLRLQSTQSRPKNQNGKTHKVEGRVTSSDPATQDPAPEGPYALPKIQELFGRTAVNLSVGCTVPRATAVNLSVGRTVPRATAAQSFGRAHGPSRAAAQSFGRAHGPSRAAARQLRAPPTPLIHQTICTPARNPCMVRSISTPSSS